MNVFLDCGFYKGDVIRDYKKAGTIDDTWKIYVFEPLPLKNTQEIINGFELDIEFIRKALWTKNGRVGFWLSNYGNASHIDGTTDVARDKMVTCNCIDFSAFVASLPKDAYIICSMDIEGAEFEILEKMLLEDTARRIGVLDIEFHHRFMKQYEDKDAKSLVKRLKAEGIKIKLKVPLS